MSSVDRPVVHWSRDPRPEEETMIATRTTNASPIVVCELDASTAASATLAYASAYCKAHSAELVVVRVVDPTSLRPSSAGGGPGIWGLLGAMALLREAVRSHGVDARVVVRIGERGRVLEEERLRLGAGRVITTTDVPPVRCPACGWRYDARAVHFCPRVHLGQGRASVESTAA
jgi:Tfp pilus assembly protein PilW